MKTKTGSQMQKCRSKTLAQTYLKSQTLYLILSLKLSLLVFTFQIIIFGHQNVFSGPFMIGELEKDFTLERFLANANSVAKTIFRGRQQFLCVGHRPCSPVAQWHTQMQATLKFFEANRAKLPDQTRPAGRFARFPARPENPRIA